ncbi:MAG: hypothetical protein QXF12_02275 [Candidatus Aenigmatarchaeota archaeon]
MKIAMVLSNMNAIMGYNKIDAELNHVSHMMARMAGLGMLAYYYLDVVNMSENDEIDVDTYNIFVIDKYYAHNGFLKAALARGEKEPKLSMLRPLFGDDFVNLLFMQLGEKVALDILKNNGIEFLLTIPVNLEEQFLSEASDFAKKQQEDYERIFKSLNL